MSVFSKNWYLVEALTPRLKPQVSITPQRIRGERKYALRDPVSGAIQMFTEEAYTVLGLMDGHRTLNQIWLETGEILQDELPTQEDMISLLASLYQMDMLYLDLPANASDLHRRLGKKQQAKRMQKVYSPLAVQIPLLDPTRLLDVLCPIIDKFFGKTLLAAYLIVIVTGIATAAQHFDALTTNGADNILAADNLILMWVLYPIIKIIHELGHAYMVRRYGGQVHEVGVMFLVLFPMPYVNASESAAFSSKADRIFVAAAGLIVELFIAAVAVILWSIAAEGLPRAIFYNVAFMAGVSTVLFNGNPLLKFDAYYMLSDYIEVPNLAKRATAYWGYLFKKYIYRFREIEDPSTDGKERLWLFFYNLASFSYRLFISITIILFIGSKYFIVGVILGIWTLFSGWILPLAKTIIKPFRESQFELQGLYPKTITLALAAGIWALLFALPLPHTYTTQGVSWTEDKERLYAAESGFVGDIAVPADGMVVPGQELIQLTNYELDARSSRVDAQVGEAKARLRSVYDDRMETGLATAELQRFQEEKTDIDENKTRTVVTALAEGMAVFQEAGKLPARFLKRGEVIGYVMHPERPLTVRVVVIETAAEQILSQLQGVRLKPASDRSKELQGYMSSVVPRVSKELPSPVLTVLGGGEIALDPASAEKMEAVENYVTLEVEVPGSAMDYVFERFYVRFDLTPASAGERILRKVRQVFIEKFEV